MAENTKVKEPILWEIFGWTQHTISRGTVYYYNTKTNKKSWERPQDLHDEDTEKAGDWIQQKIQAEIVYYYNTNTNVFTWETPEKLRQQREKQKEQLRRISTMHESAFGLQDVPLPVPNEGKHLDLQNIKICKTHLIQELKERYKQLFEAILPIPYIRDKAYRIKDIFVEGVVELKTAMWSPLSSYHDVFSDARVFGRERILTGEPGLGKSTLTMQYAYEWCTKAEGSSMKDVEILILLRLRQLHRVRSIFEAIRRFLLRQNSSLTESEVAVAIRNSLSVVVILDGLDEFPREETFSASIVDALMTGMFQKVKVLVTSRNFPSKCSPETIRFRLTGFDERAQKEYIRKAVVGDDKVAAGRIMQLLNESPILTDLCKVPLFFAMFAHMSHEDENLKPFGTVTSFFQCLIKCLYSHMRNKMDNVNMQSFLRFEEDHKELDKVAFECLSGKQIIWKKEELRERLGESLYNEYSTLGVLIEEEVPYIAREEGQNSYNESETEVRFYHQHFCDWYGAHYLQFCASTFNDKHLKETLGYLTPLRHQYCYRFACGLNRQSAGRVITYLKDNGQSDTFAELCTIEQLDEIDYSLKKVRDLCSREVVLHRDDSKVQKRSTIQVLEIASRHKIPIEMVSLTDCHWKVDVSSNFLQLSSSFRLPVLTTLRNLIIEGSDMKISERDWKYFLLYSSKCLTLETVKIYNCQMPQSLHPDFVSALTLRTCQVSWYPHGHVAFWYELCFLSGLWKLFGTERGMMEEDYHVVVQKIRSEYGTDTQQT